MGRLGPLLGSAIIALTLLVPSGGSATASFQEHIALGKASFRLAKDQMDLDAFFQAREVFLAAVETDPSHPLAHYYVALVDWCLVNELKGSKSQSERAAELADDGLEHCDNVLTLDPDHAEILALKGSLQCQLSQLRQSKRHELRDSAVINLRRAVEISPDNPRVWLASGICRLHRSRAQGGGPVGALKEFRRAVELFERGTRSLEELSGGAPHVGRGGSVFPIDPPGGRLPRDSGIPSVAVERRTTIDLSPDWGHDEAWAWAGKAHMSNEQYGAAQRCFLRALEVNPSNGEVKKELLPRVEKALDGSGEPSS